MSERKVLNKYYPPDFDPAKIPKLKLPKDRQYVVRLMAPFNMRCKTCGEYIYKGKKFNARKETVQNEVYLGLPIFRFYIKCTRCLAEITFKTDPENTDYTMEHGATRNFQAEKLLEEEEKRMQKEREEEELNNPMKVLENRTKDSKLEMEVLENLQELKELNQRQANVDFEAMLRQYKEYEEEQKRREQEEDEQEMKAMLEEVQNRRLLVDSDSDEEAAKPSAKPVAKTRPTDILQEDPQPQSKKLKTESWERSVGKLNSKSQLAGLVTVRKQKPSASLANRTENHSTTASTGSFPPATGTASTSSSLGLLGAYSDSEDSAGD
ncbi:splicing factor YJU2 [Cygnus atratus]|uniref:splicing factor YJU2 n=1 Tax=Cygnus atratus TaxID=8868 RepID=UPI0015D5D41A|nr:splicing factor YJU2 [Cygnus atratus]